MAWLFENKEVTDEMIPADAIGFVYLIVCIDKTHPSFDKRYIGKKSLTSTLTKPKTKTELREQGLDTLTKRDKKPRVKGLKKKVTQESNWRKYNSSHPELKQLVEEKPDSFKKIIIHWCKTPQLMTYYEAKLLFNNSVLEDKRFWNDNILGTFYKKLFNVKTE